MRSKRPLRTSRERATTARVALSRLPPKRATFQAALASKSRRSMGRAQGSIGFSTMSGTKWIWSATPSVDRRRAIGPSRGKTTARCTTAGSRNLRIECRLRPGPPLRAVSLMKRTRTVRRGRIEFPAGRGAAAREAAKLECLLRLAGDRRPPVSPKEVFEISLCELLRAAEIFGEHCADELTLFLRELEDLLLDRTLGYQPIRRHHSGLPDAVRAIGRLILDRWIPPRIEMDHGVGRRQIQAASTRFERDEKHRRSVVGLEMVPSLRAVLRGAVEVFVEHVILIHRPPDKLKHADELAEKEHLVAALNRRLHELAQRHELAGIFVAELAGEPKDSGVARGPAKPRSPRA